MSDAGGHDPMHESARGLSSSVIEALVEGSPAGTRELARELARRLSLPGLDRLLGVLGQYAGGAWPTPLRPVVDRVRRAAAECAQANDVEGFRRVDDELALMARAIERVPLRRLPPPPPAVSPPRSAEGSAPVLLAVVFDGIPVERGSAELLPKVRLHPPVAVALRAALDWLVGGSMPRMRIWLLSDGSALEVTCERVTYTGIQPAADVLASVGAHLGPAGGRPGAWTVRVPIVAERETFLMLEQDELQLAVPWHAVVRVRLIPADTIERMIRRQGLPVLPPLAAAARRAAEQPVLVVALGLKRACLVADRLVWRMSAEPVAAHGAPPAAGIDHMVRSDDGEEYWVLDPAWLLRGVAAPAMADPGRRGPAPPAGTPAPPPTSSPPEPPAPRTPIPFPAPARMESSGSRDAEPPATLGTEDVEPLEEAPASPVPGAPAVPATEPDAPATGPAPEARAPEPAAARTPASVTPSPRAPRQALVAEDSITARIFLVRLLEQQGFLVHAVATAAELRQWLPRARWALVCADGELPDARGEEFLLELMQQAAAASFPLVALVRDAADETVARAAGVTATLRKPFERTSLEHVLARLAPDLPAGYGGGAGGGPDPREWGAR